MEGTGVMIIATVLSAAIFSFLFYFLNKRTNGAFKEIQRELGNLSKKTKRILKFVCFTLEIFITVFLKISLNISAVGSGIILGFLGSIVDTCFKDNIIENNINKNN